MDTESRKRFENQIDRLLQVIAITLDEEIDGKALAEKAYFSRFHFQRLFRRVLGETPGAFRRRLLLERAAHTIQETAQEISAIAFESGYESLEGFSRAFRKCYGVSPSHYRRLSPQRYHLTTANGIHYTPRISGLCRPNRKGNEAMNLTDRLIQHDAWMTRRLLESAATLTEEQMDCPQLSPQKPLPFETPEATLRQMLNRMVFTKEVWVAAVNGRKMEDNPDTTISGMLKRLDNAFTEFEKIVNTVQKDDNWDNTFVDELCAPAETFSYGGMIAHVITFSAFRRISALKALESFGIDDLGYGDPIEWERASAD